VLQARCLWCVEAMEDGGCTNLVRDGCCRCCATQMPRCMEAVCVVVVKMMEVLLVLAHNYSINNGSCFLQELAVVMGGCVVIVRWWVLQWLLCDEKAFSSVKDAPSMVVMVQFPWLLLRCEDGGGCRGGWQLPPW